MSTTTRTVCEDCGCEEHCVDYRRPACLLDLSELKAAHAHYAPLVAYEILTHISVLSDDERFYAAEVEAEYAQMKDALRFTYQSRH